MEQVTNRKVAMVFAAHPDDAELGMGGTIAALVAAGFAVVVVDLTNGEPTPFGSVAKRAEETKKASKILGLEQRITLDIKNREIFDTVDNRHKVATVIRQYKPTTLFVHYWEDAHPDHIQASQLCDAARFYAKLVKTDMPHEPWFPSRVLYYFAIHLRAKVIPSFVFDITPHIEKKMEAVAAYESQFAHNAKNRRVLDLVRSESAYWGFQIQSEYGEPFACREQIALRSTQSLLDA